jgi:hypothetical protein
MQKPYIPTRTARSFLAALYKKATTPIKRLKDTYLCRRPGRCCEVDSVQLDILPFAEDSMPPSVKVWVLVDSRTRAIIGWCNDGIPAKTTRAAEPIHRGQNGQFTWPQN